GIRIFMAALVFGLVARAQGRERIRSRADYLRLFLCGFFGASLNMTMFFIGLDLTLPVNAAVLMTTSPLFVFLLASLLKTERLNFR
ncbi:MAG: EamA family transporter, partial [Bacteroidota bacterium]